MYDIVTKPPHKIVWGLFYRTFYRHLLYFLDRSAKTIHIERPVSIDERDILMSWHRHSFEDIQHIATDPIRHPPESFFLTAEISRGSEEDMSIVSEYIPPGERRYRPEEESFIIARERLTDIDLSRSRFLVHDGHDGIEIAPEPSQPHCPEIVHIAHRPLDGAAGIVADRHARYAQCRPIIPILLEREIDGIVGILVDEIYLVPDLGGDGRTARHSRIGIREPAESRATSDHLRRLGARRRGRRCAFLLLYDLCAGALVLILRDLAASMSQVELETFLGLYDLFGALYVLYIMSLADQYLDLELFERRLYIRFTDACLPESCSDLCPHQCADAFQMIILGLTLLSRVCGRHFLDQLGIGGLGFAVTAQDKKLLSWMLRQKIPIK